MEQKNSLCSYLCILSLDSQPHRESERVTVPDFTDFLKLGKFVFERTRESVRSRSFLCHNNRFRALFLFIHGPLVGILPGVGTAVIPSRFRPFGDISFFVVLVYNGYIAVPDGFLL